MDPLLKEQIERELGCTLNDADQRRFEDLNAFPMEKLDSARRLRSSLLRQAFIEFYAGRENSRYVGNFDADVVEGGQDARTWRRGRVLVPDFNPAALVQLDVPAIIAPLAPSKGERWHRLVPHRDYWEAREFLTGAPGVVRLELDYRYAPPQKVRDLLIPGPELEEIENLDISVRRWVASNIAGVAARRDLLGMRDPAALLHACFPDASSISHDGMAAAEGLVRELSSLSESATGVPGFRGLDDWYKG
jgi:hypothetical protein